jgi:hypothetical protein
MYIIQVTYAKIIFLMDVWYLKSAASSMTLVAAVPTGPSAVSMFLMELGQTGSTIHVSSFPSVDHP